MSRAIILTGVTGTGKSTVGRMLAQMLGACFFDADDFHPPDNVAKLTEGVPLTDDDRRAWLERLRDAIRRESVHWPVCVAACSALKESYRELLQESAGEVNFVLLSGSPEMLRQRLQGRFGHFMNPALLESQFATLEAPANALVVDIGPAPETIARSIAARLGLEPLIHD
jgi:gluconokinase